MATVLFFDPYIDIIKKTNNNILKIRVHKK